MQSNNQKRAPQTFAEIWEVVKDKLVTTIAFKGKSYTKEELRRLAMNS